MASVEEAAAARDAALEEAEKALAAWAPQEAAHLRDFPRAEAGLTAKTQHSITIAVGNQVPGLKKRLDATADAGAAELLAWASSLMVDDLLGEQKLWDLVMERKPQFAAGWIGVLRGVGYDPGTKEVYEAGRAYRPWGFYNPSTGTARHDRIPGGPTIKDVDDAVTKYRNSMYGLSSAVTAQNKKAAEDLWGDD